MFEVLRRGRKGSVDNENYLPFRKLTVLILLITFFVFPAFVAAQSEQELLTNPSFAGNLNGWDRSSVIDPYVSYDGNFGEAKIFTNAGISELGTIVMEQEFTIPAVALSVSLRVRHFCICNNSNYLKVMFDDTEVASIKSTNDDYAEITVADVMAQYGLTAGSTHTIKIIGEVGSYAGPGGTQSAWVSHVNLVASLPAMRSINGTITDQFDRPLPGVTVTMTGDHSDSTTTNSSGEYSISGYEGQTVTLTPTLSSVSSFSPASKEFTLPGSDFNNQNFVGSLHSYTISGNVQDNLGANMVGQALNMSGDRTGSISTDSSGNYSFTVYHGEQVNVSISNSSYNFSPTGGSYNISGSVSGEDYVGTRKSNLVTGKVLCGGIPISGAILTFSHNGGTTTTDALGEYAYPVSYGADTTITPSHPGYHGWAPASIPLTNVISETSGQDFSGTINTYQISGTITDGTNPLGGATLTFSHDGGITTSAVDGTYSYTVNYGTSTTITPTHSGYHGWSPANRTLTNVSANSDSNNFQGTINTYNISGTVTDGTSPLAGVTLTFSHNGGTTITDSSGNYSYAVNYNTTTTVTPSHEGYHGWSPANRTLTNIVSDTSGQSFTGTINTYTISGTVTDGTNPISGAAISFSHDGGATTSAPDGSYSYTVNYGTNTTITPSHSGYHGWSPANRALTNVSANVASNNFQGTINTYTISGTITDGTNPLAGVTLTFSHDNGTTTSDASGNYSYAVDFNTTTTVTPSHEGYHGWSPANRTVTGIAANTPNQNYVGVINTYQVTGNITDGTNPLEGVTITFSHDSGTTTTDTSGNYSYTVNYNTITRLTASRVGYDVFTPGFIDVAAIKENQTGKNFLATINRYTISGTVTDGTSPLSGVTLTFSHDNGTTTTDVSGNYTYSLDYDTTTTITPSHEGYHGWSPATRTVTNVAADTSGQNFAGVINTYQVSGSVTDGSNPLEGVTITFSHNGGTATTDVSGNYTYTVDYNTDTRLTPTRVGYDIFTPTFIDLSNIKENQTANDFQATINRYDISGTVTDGSNPIAGVTLTFSHNNGTTTTDASGNYTYPVDYDITTTITPSHEGYHGWSPETKTISNVASDTPGHDFTGVINTYVISGTIEDRGDPLDGVAVSFSHDGGTATTDSSGYYSYEVDYLTTTTLTPGRVGYSAWTPSTIEVTDVKEDQEDRNFEGIIDIHTISGNIVDEAGLPMQGVTVTFSPTAEPVKKRSRISKASSGASSTTDASGNYSIVLEYGTKGKLTASIASYLFVPAEREVLFVTGDVPAQNFVGEYNVGDLKIYLDPAEAGDSGASWRRVNTSPWYRNGQVEADISVGEYYVEFSDVDGWITPETIRVSISKGEVTTTSATYIKDIKYGSLKVLISPDDNSLKSARWSLAGSEVWNQSGATIDDVEVGTVTIEFKNVPGWIKPAEQTVTIKEDKLTTTKAVYTVDHALKPEVHYFTVEPEVASKGDPVTLSWDVRDAEEISIDNGIGDIDAKGSVETVMQETTTYTLIAENNHGDIKASITAEKVEEALINWFTSSNPPEFPCSLGGNATLSWNITGAERAGIDTDGDGEVEIEVNPEGGELEVTPDVEGTEYALYAYNILGYKKAVTKVAVTSLPEILSFNADHLEFMPGTKVTFSWEVKGEEALSLEPEPGEVEGSFVQVEPVEGGEYTLKAENDSGQVTSTLALKRLESETAPDLDVEFGEINQPVESAKFKAGAELTVKALVSNIGTKVARKFYVSLYSNGGDTLVDSKKIRVLEAGDSKTLVLNYLPPRSGKHNLSLQVDSTNLIPEFDENNNSALKTISVAKADGVDLLVTDVNVGLAGKGSPEGAVKISFAIANAGNVTSDSFQYRIFLSNKNRTASVVKSFILSEDHIQKIKSNGRVNISLNGLLPQYLQKKFYVIIMADVHNAVDEKDDLNNIFIEKYFVKHLE